MDKKRKLIIGSVFCIAFIILAVSTVINLGLKAKFDRKARNEAELVLLGDAEELSSRNFKFGKLKYWYTTYNKKIDTYIVSYYVKVTNYTRIEYRVLSVYLNGYNGRVYKTTGLHNCDIKDLIGTNKKFDFMENKDGKWVRADRFKYQDIINVVCLLVVLCVLVVLLFYNRNKLDSILNKSKKNKSLIDKKDTANNDSNNENIDKLKELTRMKDENLITEEEFQSKKKDILDKM